jgi:hypothetical protein
LNGSFHIGSSSALAFLVEEDKNALRVKAEISLELVKRIILMLKFNKFFAKRNANTLPQSIFLRKKLDEYTG